MGRSQLLVLITVVLHDLLLLGHAVLFVHELTCWVGGSLSGNSTSLLHLHCQILFPNCAEQLIYLDVLRVALFDVQVVHLALDGG